jgi:ribose transport system permease protein
VAFTTENVTTKKGGDGLIKPVPQTGASPGGRGNLGRFLSPRKIGAIYLWIAIVILFSAVSPHGFFKTASITNVLNEYSISGIMALAVVVPLAAGLFDLSVGYTMGMTGTVAAWLLANTGMGVTEVVIISLALGAVVGLVNGIIVVFAGIDSLIATLGTGSIIGAITLGVTGDQTIAKNVGGSFSHYIGDLSWGKVTIPVFYMLILMVIIGVVTEQTVIGRLWYAIGFDLEVTKLAGVRVKALRVSAFVASGFVAGIAGVALVARIGAASPGTGPSYLLPAFSAAFLGATQFRDGRFNAWGAVVATLLLGTGEFGLLVAGAPVWAPDVFVGAALIAAVALTEITRRRSGAGSWSAMPVWWRRIFSGRDKGDADQAPTQPVA